MLRLLQYIRGYVQIKVWGFSPERFMNLCSNHGLFLWDIEGHEESGEQGTWYTMCISIKDFYKLRSITKKTGTRVVIQKRRGLPFFVPKMKKRKVFVLGLLGSLIFWMWMSGYIWAIELQGNYYVTDDVLMEFMAEREISIGMKRSDVLIEELEKALRTEYDIITWTSARIDGTRLVVQVKENELQETAPEEVTGEEGGYDLVASKDGTVVSIITREGIPLVQEGSQVTSGQVLVQGMIPIMNEDQTVRSYQYCRADADIYIQGQIEAVEILPIWYEEKQYSTREQHTPFIELFGHRIKAGWFSSGYDTFDIIEDRKQVKLLENFYLPFYYGTEQIREYIAITKSYSSEQARDIFAARVTGLMKTLMEKGVEIIEKNVTMSKDKVNWYMNARFEVIEKTGRSVPSQDTPLEQPDGWMTDTPTDTGITE